MIKGLLLGFSLLPATLGCLVIFHTFIDTKSNGRGGEITNRIARAELVWLAMNKPRLFCDMFDWVCQDVQDRREKEEKNEGLVGGMREPGRSNQGVPQSVDVVPGGVGIGTRDSNSVSKGE